MGRSHLQVGHSKAGVGHSEGALGDAWTALPLVDRVPDGGVVELRTQGLSIRAISERTGIPRSTIADHLVRAQDATPVRIVGRDGRRYLAIRDPRLNEPAPTSRVPGNEDARTDADPGLELRRLLLLESLRQARALLPDLVPVAEHDRLRIALDLAAIARTAGVRDGDVARARAVSRPARHRLP